MEMDLSATNQNPSGNSSGGGAGGNLPLGSSYGGLGVTGMTGGVTGENSCELLSFPSIITSYPAGRES